MEYTTLGESGLSVRRICLGCMSFGSSDWQEWVLDEEDARPILEDAGYSWDDDDQLRYPA